jgi:hypothetical protein
MKSLESKDDWSARASHMLGESDCFGGPSFTASYPGTPGSFAT